jgi:hypothetical protein
MPDDTPSPELTVETPYDVLTLLLSTLHFRMWAAALRKAFSGMMKFAHAKLVVKA